MAMIAVEQNGACELEASGGFSQVPDRGCIAVVADGMGGVRGGATASKKLQEFMLETVGSSTCPGPGEQPLRDLVNTINQRILQIAREEPRLQGMGSTLTLGWLMDRNLTLANVGDSRLYRFRNQAIEQLSHDQSPVGRLLREGRITAQEARVHPHRNVIDQAVGSHPEGLDPEIVTFPVESGDIYLLCSDGLNEEVWDHEMAEILQEGKRMEKPLLAIAEDLVYRALDAGGKDNVTAILLEVH